MDDDASTLEEYNEAEWEEMPRVESCPTSRLSSCPRRVQVPRKRPDCICFSQVYSNTQCCPPAQEECKCQGKGLIVFAF